jgi:hypothetical protein
MRSLLSVPQVSPFAQLYPSSMNTIFILNIATFISNIMIFMTNIAILVIAIAIFISNIMIFMTNVAILVIDIVRFILNIAIFVTNIKAMSTTSLSMRSLSATRCAKANAYANKTKCKIRIKRNYLYFWANLV